jgi:hypothetical protein
MPKIIQPANRLLALLENARELAVIHQQRTVAADVVNGCRIYANTLRLPLDETFCDLAEAVRSKNPFALNESFDRVEQKIVSLCLVK